MRDNLEGLYQDELRSLREDAVRFAARNPGMARQLGLSADTIPDPLVDRLLESCAWLTARARADAQSRLPLVSHSLLGLLYPQFVSPVPSIGVVEFTPNPSGIASLTEGFLVPSGTPMHTIDEDGGALRWRTAWPIHLHPAQVSRAEILPPAAWMPASAQNAPAVLRLRIVGSGGLSLASFTLSSLRLHLAGSGFSAFLLYEWALSTCCDVILADDAEAKSPKTVSLGRAALRPVGFGADELLLPESAYAHPGYQLLQEYFAHPEHLLFWDVMNLDRRHELGELHAFDLLLPMTAEPPDKVEARLFRTCATPIVNLSERLAEPLRVDYEHSAYLLVPDIRQRKNMEVHSVLSVNALEGGERTSVTPYFSLAEDPNSAPGRYWFMRRQPSLDGVGTDVFLSFKEAGFRPETARPWVASVRVLCTSRHQAADRWRQGELTRDTDMPVSAIQFCGPPSRQHDPPMFGGELWKLVSHLSLHHLSLTGPDAAHVLRELLRLYALRGDAFSQRQISAVRALSAKPSIIPLRSAPGCAARGTLLDLTLDEDAFQGGSAFLFASVLDVFFGLYASVNSFTQLTLKSPNRKGVWYAWPPRVGIRPLL